MTFILYSSQNFSPYFFYFIDIQNCKESYKSSNHLPPSAGSCPIGVYPAFAGKFSETTNSLVQTTALFLKHSLFHLRNTTMNLILLSHLFIK